MHAPVTALLVSCCLTQRGSVLVFLCLYVCCCPLQLYAVTLHRKPLFPGIYTPVTIKNNAKLIREIMEKKQGG